MECAAKPTKPTSNLSEFVSKFARVCKLRSVVVENPNHHYPKTNINAVVAEDSSDATTEEEETEFDGVRIYPQPSEVFDKSNAEIMKIFDTVSALKVAYVQLQNAHLPYDPDKIKAADELVLSQLQVLCKIKRAYKEKQFKKVGFEPKCSEVVLAEIQAQEKRLQILKSQVKPKDSDILCLRRELHDLDLKNGELAEKLGQASLEEVNVRFLACNSFQEASKAVSKSVHDFAKPLIGLLKASGWDLDLAANAIEKGVVYSKRCHKKYVFEAYIARRMFCGASPQSYNVDAIMRFDDPINALMEDPNSPFAKFCQRKYLIVIHPRMEASFFGNLDHREFVSSGKHPRTLFYQSFVKMAKWVWILHGIAGSVEPKAEMFGVKRGAEFSDAYMESVEEDRENPVKYNEEQSGLKVEFMVTPGFRIGEALVKSRVYVSRLKS